MLILTALKRTTALAAIAALPLAPAAAFAESAQVTGTQPPSAETGTTTGQQATGQQTTGQQTTGQQATGTSGQATGQGGQADAAATATGAKPGSTGAQAGEASDEAKSDEVKQKDTAGKSAGQSDGQTTQAEGEAGSTAGQSGAATGQGTQSQQAGADDDMLVAKVGDREIRRSDVLTVIGMLPPQLQQQPPEMLIPIALDQLVMRELILQEAREDGLGSDPAVDSLQAGASERDKEDAMVQVWLEKELGDAVTEEKVRQTYDTVKQQMGDQAPDVDTLRPQIEQELRQQAFLELSRDLQEDAEITLYGPDGKAVTQ